VKLDPEAAVLSGLSQEQMASLRRYEVILRERAIPHGLISRADATRLWDRHFLDSLRAVACIDSEPPEAELADLGSGAGLPGIPVAIALPAARMTLIEPRARRAAFLEMAAQEIGLSNVVVDARRAEQVRSRVDACLARALAVPAVAWKLAKPLLRPGGRLVYFGGGTFALVEVRETVSDASVDICESALFPDSGSLVIMQPALKSSPPSR
jgi:16S rRNA (guanine527-N7)-methyltransferase